MKKSYSNHKADQSVIRNYVAKHDYNMAQVFRDRKKDCKRGYTKHRNSFY